MATVLISKENPDSQKLESYRQMMHEGAHVGCHAAIGRHPPSAILFLVLLVSAVPCRLPYDIRISVLLDEA